MGVDDKRMDRVWEAAREHFDGLYLSFETGLGRLAEAFPPATLFPVAGPQAQLRP